MCWVLLPIVGLAIWWVWRTPHIWKCSQNKVEAVSLGSGKPVDKD